MFIEYFNTFNLTNFVEKHAKFQKVMILYDCSLSSPKLRQIYEEIKDLCVFNQKDINDANLDEIYNGYKLLIFVCSANSFLHFKYDIGEFDCLFYPESKDLLPFCFDTEAKLVKNRTIVANSSLDINIVSSLYFNQFLLRFFDVFSLNPNFDFINFSNKEIYQKDIFDLLSSLPEQTQFADIYLLKQENLDYQNISLVHLIILNAILIFLQNVRTRELSMVDIYKTERENVSFIDKVYALSHNQTVFEIINLNYHYLTNLAESTKSKILDYLNLDNISAEDVTNVIEKTKNFCKNSNSTLAYLYIYNIFE